MSRLRVGRRALESNDADDGVKEAGLEVGVVEGASEVLNANNDAPVDVDGGAERHSGRRNALLLLFSPSRPCSAPAQENRCSIPTISVRSWRSVGRVCGTGRKQRSRRSLSASEMGKRCWR